MRESVYVLMRPGPNWVEGKSSREQPHWDGHSDFVDEHYAAGVLQSGGPFSDLSGLMMIFDGGTSVPEVFEGDPWIREEIVVIEDVRTWQRFVG